MGLRSKLASNYWLSSGIYTFGQRILMMIFGFGGFLILVRLLSKTDFGVVALFLSITTILEVLRNGLLRNGLIREVQHCETDEERQTAYRSSLALNFAFSLFQIAIYLFGASYFARVLNAPGLDTMLYIQIIGALIMPFFWHFEYIGQAHFSFKGMFWSHVLYRGSYFVYIGVSWLFSLEITLALLSWASVIAMFLGALAGGLLTMRYRPLRGKASSLKIKELFNYGRFTFGTNVSAQSLKNVDQWFLGGMIGPSAVAAYNPAIRVSGLVEVPTLSVAQMLFPQVAKRIKEEGLKAAKELYESSVAGILSITIPMAIFIMLFPEWIILVIAGPEYLDTVDILRVTVLYTLFIPYARQFGVVLDAIGLQKVNFYFVMVSALMNVGFNWFFINSFGTIGAAYGTLATYMVGFIYNQIYLRRKLGTNPLRTVLGMGSIYKKLYQMVKKKV